MTGPREMTRSAAARLAVYALLGSAASAVLAGVCARLASPLGGSGLLAAVLSAIVLLLSVAALIGLLILMYALYAIVRGPMSSGAGSSG